MRVDRAVAVLRGKLRDGPTAWLAHKAAESAARPIADPDLIRAHRDRANLEIEQPGLGRDRLLALVAGANGHAAFVSDPKAALVVGRYVGCIRGVERERHLGDVIARVEAIEPVD